MPFENLNNNHYLVAEKTAALAALTALETALAPRLKNLSPEERNKYGSIKEQNKLVVNKVRDFRNQQPALSSADVDWVEFEADFLSREFIATVISRLQNTINNLNNNRILHDYDNFQASLTDYDYSKYKLSTKAVGYEDKVNEIAQFFNRTGTTNKPAEPNEPVV
jgi:hypothetical protein